jgi:hypothetical protein
VTWLLWAAPAVDFSQLAAFVVVIGGAAGVIFRVMLWAVDGHRAIKAVPKLAHRVYLLEKVLSEIIGEGRLPEWDLTELLEEEPIKLPHSLRKRQLPPGDEP